MFIIYIKLRTVLNVYYIFSIKSYRNPTNQLIKSEIKKITTHTIEKNLNEMA